MCGLNLPQTFTVHLSSITQFEEVSLPWYILFECMYAIARATSVAKENLNPQFSGMSSFCSTSLRLPLGQYSLIKEMLSVSLKVAPMNLHTFGWSSVLQCVLLRQCLTHKMQRITLSAWLPSLLYCWPQDHSSVPFLWPQHDLHCTSS